MRWLASRPRWLLLGCCVVLLGCVGLGQALHNAVLEAAVVLLFFFFFATLMAFVARPENPRPHSPR
jgi:hypothetical protein